MATGFGHVGWIGFGVESTYGTPVASSKYTELMSENFKFTQGQIPKPSLRRITQKHSVSRKKEVTGGFEAQFSYDGLELLLKHALGGNSTSGGGDPYTHTMSLATALPTGLTFNVNRDAAAVGSTSAFQYHGCNINKLTFKQELEDFLIVGFDVVGEDQGLIAIETPTYPTFIGADWEQLVVTINSVAVNPESVEITLDNSLATDRYKLGSLIRKGLGRNGPRNITGSMTLEFESLTAYNYYKNQSNVAIVFTWTYSANRTLTITIPNAKFTGEEPEMGSAGPIKFKLGWQAYYSAADNDELALVLKNGTSTIS